MDIQKAGSEKREYLTIHVRYSGWDKYKCFLSSEIKVTKKGNEKWNKTAMGPALIKMSILILLCMAVFAGLLFNQNQIQLLAEIRESEQVGVAEQKENTLDDKHRELKSIGVRAGVWNDGQAAPWDLNILNHFRFFGQKQRARGYRPEQPLRFSHVTHVQQNGVECQYCHWAVSKSLYAGIPEMENCRGCHNRNAGIGLGSGAAQKAEIAKLSEYLGQKEPIPWVKVHVMPDFVRFNHKRHIRAGLACQACHGQISEMPVVERVSSMKMGWCIDCHRAKGTSIDCETCHK